jgi:hypothetical protein
VKPQVSLASDGKRPLVSLVITSRHGGGDLLACIESFVSLDDGRFEVIVVTCAPQPDGGTIGRRFPSVRVEHLLERRSTPELRAKGLRAAQGDLMAMTTERCRADRDWLLALRKTHEGSAAAVGGAIEYRGSHRAIDRAVFFCEYGRYMLPFAGVRTSDLPGQNVSYTRAALDAVGDLVDNATWEPLWHWRLASQGFELVRDPARLVWMERRFTLGGFLSERYHYSRAFAGQRVARSAWVVRLAYAAGTLLLPPLLWIRFLRQSLARRGRRLELLALMPLVMLFTLPWAGGELVGYLAGPGSSAARID